jgi:hypothetical protein
MVSYWHVFDTKIIHFLVEERLNISCPQMCFWNTFVTVTPGALSRFKKTL